MVTDKSCKYINSLMELIVISIHIWLTTGIPLNAMLKNTPLKNINLHYYTQAINYMTGEDRPSIYTMHCVLAILQQCSTFNEWYNSFVGGDLQWLFNCAKHISKTILPIGYHITTGHAVWRIWLGHCCTGLKVGFDSVCGHWNFSLT
jgi:hypothetical protein